MKYFVVVVGLIFSCSFVKAQISSTSDSISTELALIEKYHPLFGREWSKKFVEMWNSNKDTAKVLHGLGNVYFVSTGKETTTALMSFDSSGLATYKAGGYPAPKDSTPKFTATVTRWAEFMEGKYHAVAGVLSRKIEYQGPMTIAFKYGWHFDKVAPVGRKVVEILEKKKPEWHKTK
ncbi:MAG: hypothetical protein HY033_07760 [Ignavibacteriae bacterium]|nr:hypothetical protein [Ignavibacteria bacterium]MBI3364787.1 hypothetical protein [Ignavibacteriota bacterium]